jgi:hypothetical protein
MMIFLLAKLAVPAAMYGAVLPAIQTIFGNLISANRVITTASAAPLLVSVA